MCLVGVGLVGGVTEGTARIGVEKAGGVSIASVLTTPPVLAEGVWSLRLVVQVGRGKGEISTSSSELAEELKLISIVDLLTFGLPPTRGIIRVGVAGCKLEWVWLGEVGRAVEWT